MEDKKKIIEEKIYEALYPLQCLNCHKVLKCDQCDWHEVYDEIMKLINEL